MRRADASAAIALSDAVVVVIDDHDANIDLVMAMLRRMGISKLHAVRDSRHALGMIRALDPDLIVLDLHMPHMDGFDVMAGLRRLVDPSTYLPILVLTADSGLDAKHRALAAGAHDFLAKPIDHRELVLRITHLLETRALHVALRSHNAALAAEIRAGAGRAPIDVIETERRGAALRRMMSGDELRVVVQPIRALGTGTLVGVEALARFDVEPSRPPDVWFDEAHRLGLGLPLELAAARRAIALSPDLPDDVYLSINASPATTCHPVFAELIATTPGTRIVVELTEHIGIDDYDAVVPALDQLRLQGVRIAVDDAGAGFASLQHVLRLLPEIIKLDGVFTRTLDRDPVRRAMVSAFVGFAREIGATIVAEGIESAAEVSALIDLGVEHGQGYFLGRPGSVSDVFGARALDHVAPTAARAKPSVTRRRP